MKQNKKLQENLLVGLAMLGFAFLLVSPQLLNKQVILGSDSIFHYNRFYETAMQLKEGNFSYFISLYGFQESGRIVNALYGPFFAYLQGGLVLLSGTWFRYQIISRVLLHILGAASMYTLLKQCKVKTTVALGLGFLYVTTFSIQYWTMRQGFSSWGAALLPYCFIPAIRYVQSQKVEPIRLALSLALMFQVHVLSSIILVMLYIPLYLYTFVKVSKEEKKKALVQVALATVIFLFLTVNVWSILLYLRANNHLLDPFINRNMAKNGIDGTAKYWLHTPESLFYLIILQPIFLVYYWKKMAVWKRTVNVVYFFFILLSTSLFPWQYLLDRGNSFAELIQFPFRFFVPATVLLLLIIGLSVNQFDKWRQNLSILLMLFVGIGLIQNISDTTKRVNSASKRGDLIPIVKHTYVDGSYQNIKETMHDTDLSQFLKRVIKPTPDYVPIYGNIGKQNTYDLYYANIVVNQNATKKRQGSHLLLTWEADAGQEVNLPVVKYHNTKLNLNGQYLTEKDYHLSTIGTPSVKSQAGRNRLELSFVEPRWTLLVIVTPILTLIGIGFYKVYKGRRYKKVA